MRGSADHGWEPPFPQVYHAWQELKRKAVEEYAIPLYGLALSKAWI
jgi:hypothetical protein